MELERYGLPFLVAPRCPYGDHVSHTRVGQKLEQLNFCETPEVEELL